MIAKFFSKNILIGFAFLLIVLTAVFTWFHFHNGYQLGVTENSMAVGNITPPAPTYYGNKDKISPNSLTISFDKPVAPLDNLETEIKDGIKIQPDIRGIWQWQNGSTLSFLPETDWLPDTSYKVTFSPKIFTASIKLKDYSLRFDTPAFSGKLEHAEFYENPQNLKNKAVTASFRFTYPLDTNDLKNNIHIQTVGGDAYDFDYKLDEHNTVLHLISKPVKIKDEEDFAKISLNRLGNAYNQKILKDNLQATVKIPSSTTFFKLKNLYSDIVRNPNNNNNPEQILNFEFTTAVNKNQLSEAIELKSSQEECYILDQKKSSFDNEFIQSLQHIELTPVTSQFDNAKNHQFKYDIRQNSGCLLVLINNNLSSTEGFRFGRGNGVTATITNLSPYPLEADIAFDGSVMSLQGSRKVAFISRGAKELDVNIARIKEDDLNHLITQTYGSFAQPNFDNYNFSENNIAEIFHKKLPLNLSNPAEANYSSLDLNKYFQNRKGIFLISVQGKNEKIANRLARRLIILTDLGIVVKDNLDKTHDIFISDIAAEKPVFGALVEVLGQNGLPILSAKTDRNGVAKIGDYHNFKNEKQAVAYKVTFNNDISFLPLNREDRKLNLSRFNVGGNYIDGSEVDNSPALQGYIFSDRGIYRPSESGHLGILVRQSDLNIPQNLPMELTIRKPNGEILATKKLSGGTYGFMEYEFKLPANTPTGIYSVDLWLNKEDKTQSFVAYSTFRVEEFMPDTLKIKANFSPDLPSGWFNNEKLTADVYLQNLYGSPAAKHILQSEYKLTPASFNFAALPEYTFRNPLQSSKTQSYNELLSEVTTDDKGFAQLNLDLSSFAEGTYRLNLKIDGMEVGSARGVGTSLSALVSPVPYLVGWKTNGKLNYINKNSERRLEFLAVDNNLQPLELSDLTLQILQKKYVSALVEQKNGTYQYQNVAKEEILTETPWKISASGEKYDIPTDKAGNFVLRLSDKSSRVLAQIEYNIAGETNLTQALDKDANLGLKLNKSEYKNGEEIEMQISAPYLGYGLITIERDNVYAYKWFKVNATSLTENITLPQNIEGNAYINVAVFRSLQSAEIYVPAISYATVPFNINKENRTLNINLDVPQKVKSGEDLIIKYQTSEPAQLVIYGVNEGILQVADYQAPNLLDVFMGKRALRVVTSQIMDLIMPDIRFLRTLSSSGGDGGDEAENLDRNLNPFARKTDKPVAFWSGILDSSQNSVGSYSYHVPETFNGTITVMAVAVSPTRFGNTEKSVIANSDFALIPSGPYNVVPNDEFIMGLSVGNLVEESENSRIKVSLSVENGLEILDDKDYELTLPKNGETQLKFRLKALPVLGNQTLIFKAQSLTDPDKHSAMPYTLSIRPPVPFNTKIEMGLAKSSYKLKDIEDLYAEYRVQKLSASVSPLLLAQGLLPYLNKYPHYCTEQTVSKIFPAMEIFFKSPDLLNDIDIYALFDDAVKILGNRQTSDGGFKSWNTPELSANTRDSLYAAHFLVMAQKHGFKVPYGLLSQALLYCEKIAASQPDSLDDISPAYAAYILTVHGKITTNYLLNLEEFYKNKEAKNWQTHIGAKFLAASYKLLQDIKHADTLASSYKNSDNPIFNAMNVYLTATHFPETFKELDKQSVETLLKPLSAGNFTTYSAGWSVLALNALDFQKADSQIKFSGLIPNYTPFPTINYTLKNKGLEASSPQPFYYVNTQQGFTKNQQIKATAQGLDISKTYLDKNGQAVTSAKLGDILTVKISYRSLGKEPVYDVAITDLLAGCFEIVNNSLTTEGFVDSTDIREDRINVYTSAYVYELSFSYKVKIVAAGSFTVPPVFASAMYQPLVSANSESKKIIIGD